MHDRRLNYLTLTFVLALSASAWSVSAETDKPATLEKIPGSEMNRVVLTPKAAERLAIATAAVREESVKRSLLVEGKVDAAPAGSSESARESGAGRPATGEPLLCVHLVEDPERVEKDPQLVKERAKLITALKKDDEDDEGDNDDEDDDKSDGESKDNVSVTVIPIGPAKGPMQFKAKPVQSAAAAPRSSNGDAKGKDAGQSYEVDRGQPGLQPGQRVYVKLSRPDSGEQQTVIPYSAVLYDAKGGTWTYTAPEPLVFVRHRIEIESIVGDRAVLKQGLQAGTSVVTLGAVELLGIEQKFGH